MAAAASGTGDSTAQDELVATAPELVTLVRAIQHRRFEEVKRTIEVHPTVVEKTDGSGRTALHFAATAAYKEAIGYLLDSQARTDVEDFDFNTPLMLAAKHGQQLSVELLLDRGADVNHTNQRGVTALHHAAMKSETDIMRYLISRGLTVAEGTTEAGTALHWAVQGNASLAAALLVNELKYSPDITDGHGMTPLFTVEDSSVETAQVLLESGANVNFKGSGNTTALHIAVVRGQVEAVKLLIAWGADAHAADSEGNTPLQLAQTGDAAKRTSLLHALNKVRATPEKLLEDSERFKASGNKVFANGEFNKAKKFYTLAISTNPKNHALFSNRSACNYNVKNFEAAAADAHRSIALKPDWSKGYVRLASSLAASTGRQAEALAVIAKGLAVEPGNKDLTKLEGEVRAALERLEGQQR